MKLSLPLILAGLVAAGCASESTAPSTSTTTTTRSAPAETSSASFSTAALTQAFRNADLATVQTVSGIVSAVGAKNYSSALADLQKVAKIPGLTAEQETAVKQLMSQLTAKK